MCPLRTIELKLILATKGCFVDQIFVKWLQFRTHLATIIPPVQNYLWLRHQDRRPSHKVQWLEDNVGSAISTRCLQLVADVAV